MFINLLAGLFRHEKITTTTPKARELKRLADKVVTLGKTGGLSNLRLAAAMLGNAEVTTKVFKTIAPRFSDRLGGYTRIVRVGRRMGDGADMSIVELLEGAKPAVPKKGRGGKAPAAEKKAADKGAAAAPKAEKKAAPKRAKKAGTAEGAEKKG
jgi:large subunit ribosomal protein L17